MSTGKKSQSDHQDIDEEHIMNIMSGKPPSAAEPQRETPQETKVKDKASSQRNKKVDYETVFLINRFPAGRNGKVVYIRPEYHERLLRIVQLTREDKTTLYSYIDNILEYHFKEFGNDITEYFNERFKPIL